MEAGTLLSHIDTDLVTREQLALVETPEATRSFKPVPHIELINTLEHVLNLNQITIRKERFALRRDGATLFGVLQLQYQDTPDGMAALGLRTSNNRTMSIQLCAGLSVFVCDNMVFRGDLIALNRKHTAGLHLRTEINHAILRFQDHFGRLTGEIENLKERLLPDTDAKAILHDVFVKGILPSVCFPKRPTSILNHLSMSSGHAQPGAYTMPSRQWQRKCPSPRAYRLFRNSADTSA
jgi:hypothetical protein